MKKLTKKQIKEFARIKSGQFIFNCSGAEFDESNLSDGEVENLYEAMSVHSKRLLKEGEYILSSTNLILDHVRKNY